MCREAWATASRRSRTAPRTRTSSTRTGASSRRGLHLREPRGPGAGHPVADPAGGVRAQRGRPHHPMLRDARPMAPRRTMVTGYNGQLGHAIRDYVEEHGLEGFEFNDIDTFDFSDPAQYGRLTFTRDMAKAIFHLLDSGAPFGTYDLTGSGAVRSWADIAREVFSIRPTATATRCARSRPRSTSRTRRPRSARVRRIPPCRSPRSRTPGTTRRIGRKPSRHTSPRNLASKA